MNIDAIKNGIVLDHIKAGKSMEIYHYLGLDELDCSVAIIKNAVSNKMGKKDIIKIADTLDINLDVLGYVDPDITVCYIKDGKIVYGGMTCTDDFDEILVPSEDHNTPWNDLGISAECASFNGCIPTGTIVFRGYFTKQYDWHEREEYVVDASKEVMDLFEKYVVA